MVIKSPLGLEVEPGKNGWQEVGTESAYGSALYSSWRVYVAMTEGFEWGFASAHGFSEKHILMLEE